MDPFAVLGIERAFDVDLGQVERTHRELSKTLHPDRFAKSGASERRLALEKAVLVNEAWRVVRDPIQRAEALFLLAGIKVGERAEPQPSADFLMEMMDQREALAEAKAARDLARVEQLAGDVEARKGTAERALAAGFRAGVNPSLVHFLGELRFYRRFLDEVSLIEEEIQHGAA
jgi:molecular chaperone HscB